MRAMWRTHLRQRAEQQHSLIGLETISEFDGAERRKVQRHLASEEWERLQRGVWRLVGSVDTAEQRVMAAVLGGGPGSVVSHQTAAWIWDLPGFEPQPVHLTRLRGSNSANPPDATVHRVRAFPAGHVRQLGSLPVVSPELLLLQLAGCLPSRRVERLLDHAWSRRLTSGPAVEALLSSLSKQGRPGLRLLRELVQARGPQWVPPASGLEGRVMELLEKNGIHGFRRQVDLGGHHWVGRVDFTHQTKPVVLEVQSERYHLALTNVMDDARRMKALRSAGFTVVEIWENDVWHRPDRWLADVRTALARAQTRSGTA